MPDLLPWPPTLTPLLDITIPGDPTTQGSLRTFRNGGVTYPKHTIDHRNHVINALFAHFTGPPLTGPIAVHAQFRFRRPGTHYHPPTRDRPARTVLRDTAPAWHTTKGRGDADKLARLIGDALEIARVIDHDSLIALWRIEKRYALTGTEPATYLLLYQLED